MTLRSFVNPKVGASCDPVDSWYRYYAGYSAGFVEQALSDSAHGEGCARPLERDGDHHGGRSEQNVAAIGFDVNPALVVVSRARLLGGGVWASIGPLGDDVVAHATGVVTSTVRFGFGSPRARRVRFAASSRASNGFSSTAVPPLSRPIRPRRDEHARRLLLHGPFRTVRVLIASRAGTNPTWWKRVEEADRLDPSQGDIVAQFRASATELASGLHRDHFDGGVDVRVGLGDSRRLPLEERRVDTVVGSPPYCTRIDYGVATRPELAVLGAREHDIRRLRDRMVGTPTMTGEHGTPAIGVPPRLPSYEASRGMSARARGATTRTTFASITPACGTRSASCVE